MKSPFFFIVKPLKGRRYNNTKELSGVEFITSTSEGDTLLVHHNVFKFYNDMKGRQQSGRSFFKDNLFFVENDQFYMYKHDDKWHCHDRYCFIKPVNKEESFLHKNFKEEPLIGTAKYVNKYLSEQGVSVGDRITFKPESEYEFEVDGEKLYRMYDHQITVVL